MLKTRVLVATTKLTGSQRRPFKKAAFSDENLTSESMPMPKRCLLGIHRPCRSTSRGWWTAENGFCAEGSFAGGRLVLGTVREIFFVSLSVRFDSWWDVWGGESPAES